MSINISMPSISVQLTGPGSGTRQEWYSFFATVGQVAHNCTLSGATADRPTSLLPNRWIGMPYLDTDLAMPIWLQSVGPDVWIDATGTPV